MLLLRSHIVSASYRLTLISAFDSTTPEDVYLKVIARLRAKSIEAQVVRDLVAAAFQSVLHSGQKGYLVNLMAGSLFHKQRGGATGGKGTTTDNSLALLEFRIDVYFELVPHASLERFLTCLDVIHMSDDHVIGQVRVYLGDLGFSDNRGP